VTRDRNYGETEWAGRPFVLIDTGGFDHNAGGHLAQQVQEQSRLALSEADVVLFLFDGKTGLNPLDQEAVKPLRKVNKPVLFVVNKLDSRQRAQNLYEFYALGLERLYSISAEHGLGIAELLDSVVEQFPADVECAVEPEREGTVPLRIAVVGRPNVGKSTLINRLLGFDRSVVDATPGTTRDALEAPFELKGAACTLVDTAGIRRKARIHDRVERFSVNHSLRSVDRGDLVIHLLDGPEGVTDQDAQILSYGFERGKALLVAVNKWDLVAKAGATVPGYRDEVYYRLPFLDFVPVVFISAATGSGVEKMLATAAQVIQVYQRKISTSVFNQILQETVRAHPAPLSKGKPVKFYYGTQTGTRPPTFTLFVNSPRAVSETYRRYLIHQLRQHLGLDYAPMRLILRARREPRRSKGHEQRGFGPGR
jgi:GTP-binding protein